MTIFSLYIFDRSHLVQRHVQRHPPSSLTVPADPLLISLPDIAIVSTTKTGTEPEPSDRPPSLNFRPAVHRLPPASTGTTAARESIFSDPADGLVNGVEGRKADGRGRGLPFDEEAKLVYGVVLSLRNMVKKLSGR